MAGYLFKLLFVVDILLGNVLISQLPLTWACFLVSDSCVGRARFGWFQGGKHSLQIVSASFRSFRLVSGHSAF